ncbi:DUF6735 family protein [Halorussus caseinilyticus]|uniref:DUF6735 family protein n=1 Tax=Halorussus caseinilyticus TaxID=3034025 RepID=A0ABD5WTK3_9EURY|nr:DUF6735 family protein [Halorussus sp. DT72]
MGHRALLAYRRDDSTGPDATDADDPDCSRADATYDLHRSHWGGADFALADRLSAETPFATDTAFAVDPDPVATDCSLAEIVADRLDFLHHEAFYRVGTDYETTPFHVWWFGLDTESETVERSETVGHGAAVEARPDDDFLRGWLRATKAVVGDGVDWGALTPEEATDYLADRAEAWADDREVILPDRRGPL